jgi:hypothetical protein
MEMNDNPVDGVEAEIVISKIGWTHIKYNKTAENPYNDNKPAVTASAQNC